HPWFPFAGPSATATDPNPPRLRRFRIDDTELVEDESGMPSAVATPSAQTGSRSPLEGHGTFIAGLIRQGCPEADILSIPVMDNDGLAEESEILNALLALFKRHAYGQDNNVPEDVIDVLSLSLGYYAEDDSYRSGPI